jgi:hypothetical protein
MNVKNRQLLWDLYAVLQRMLKKPSKYHGTHMNEECQQLFVAHMRVLQGMQNANGYYRIYMWVLQ